MVAHEDGMEELCFKITPYIMDALRDIRFPFQTIDDFTGIDSQSIVVISDYGGDNYNYRSTNYDINAYYITDWNNSGLLVKLFREIKLRYKISDRTIDYKGRKDKLKWKAFLNWMSIIRNYPGIIYVMAFDKRIENNPVYKEDLKKLQKEISEKGIYDKIDIGLRMIKILSFLVFLCPLLKEKHKLCWVSDDDQIFDTPLRRKALEISMTDIVNQIIEHPLSLLRYATPFKDKSSFKHFEEMLSIADMAAGAFAASLTYNKERRLLCPDNETVEIIEEFAKIKDYEKYKVESMLSPVFGFSVFDLDLSMDGKPYLKHYKIELNHIAGETENSYHLWPCE